MKHRWGIIGTGTIANAMANALQVVENAEIVAVCSRTMSNAENFAQKYAIPNTYNSIDAFLADETIEHIYVATPHINHENEVIACLKAGKNVLGEKPLGVNAAQVKRIISVAKLSGKLLMEAMWTQFFPAILKMHHLIQSGELGEILQIKADFCFRGEWIPNGRHLNPDLAGGALLDVGIYTLYFAHCIKKELPTEIQTTAKIGTTGVDEQSAYQLTYADGCIAQLSSAVQTEAPMDAIVIGTKGWVKIPMFWNPDELILNLENSQKTIRFDRLGNGYTYEVLAFQKTIEEGKVENETLAHSQSLIIAEMMDTIRSQWNLKYPFE